MVSPVCSFARPVAGMGEQEAVGGQPLLVGAAGSGEGVGEQADRDVMAERGPGTTAADQGI